MPGPSAILVIDARPRGPRGPMAAERVLGRTVLAHLVDAASACGPGPFAVHARADEHADLRRSLGGDALSVIFATGPPPEDRAVLRADRLYDPIRVRKAIHAGKSVETAVIWRLDQPMGLASAEDELVRRRTYQPLGRFWALAPAKILAQALVPTIARPNAVTLAATAFMLIAAGLVASASSSLAIHVTTAILLALALVLDTADGHLARLQGTASAFGRWLDAVLDELADMVLHAAIAWSMFVRSGSAGWLVAGMIYAIGKYLFVIAQQEGCDTKGEAASSVSLERPSLLARCVRIVGHADVRWHLWIGLAAIGRLEIALIAYAAYFPIRTLAIAAKKAVHRA